MLATQARAAAASVVAGVLPLNAVAVVRPTVIDGHFVSLLATDTAACVAALANSGGGVAVVGVVPTPAGGDAICVDVAMAAVNSEDVLKSLTAKLASRYYPRFEMNAHESGDSGATSFFVERCALGCILVVVTGVPARGCALDVDGLKRLMWRTAEHAVVMDCGRALTALEQDVLITSEALMAMPVMLPFGAALRLIDAPPRPEGQIHDNKAGVLFESPFAVQDLVTRWVRKYAYLLMNAATGAQPATLALGVYDGTFHLCPLLFAPSMTADQVAATVRADVAKAVRETVFPPQPMERVLIKLEPVDVRVEDLVSAGAAAGAAPLLLQFDTYRTLRLAADRFLLSQGKQSCLVPLWTRTGQAALPPTPLAFDDSTPVDDMWFAVSRGADAASVQILRDAATPRVSAAVPAWSELRPALAFVVTIEFAASSATVVQAAGLVAHRYLRRGAAEVPTRMSALDVWVACRSCDAWAAQVQATVRDGLTLSLLVHGAGESPVAAEMRRRLPLSTWAVDHWSAAPAGDDRRADRLPNLDRLRSSYRSQALRVVVDASGVADVRLLVDDVLRLGANGRRVLEVALLASRPQEAWDAVSELLSLWVGVHAAGADAGSQRVVFHLFAAAAAAAYMRAPGVALPLSAPRDELTADLVPLARRFLEGDTAAFVRSPLPRLRVARVDFPRDNELAILAAVSRALASARCGKPGVVHVGQRWFGSGATTTAWRCMHDAAAAAAVAEAAAAGAARVAVCEASTSSFDAVRLAVATAAAADASADAGAAATPVRLAVLVLVHSAMPLADHAPPVQAARDAPVSVVVVNVSEAEVTPAGQNLDARLTLAEMRRGISAYQRVFTTESAAGLSQLADELGLAPAGATDGSAATAEPAADSAVRAAATVPAVMPDATAASCGLLTLGLAARQQFYTPIQRVLVGLVPAGAHVAAVGPAASSSKPAIARLVLTVAVMELFAQRAADARGVPNPLSAAVAAGVRDADPQVLLLLQQQSRHEYPVTLHPAFAPMLLARAAACCTPPNDPLLSGAPHDRLVVVLAGVVNHLIDLSAYGAADDLVLGPASDSGGVGAGGVGAGGGGPGSVASTNTSGSLREQRYSPLVLGLWQASPVAAVDFMCLLLQPGYRNLLLGLPSVHAYYVLLARLARAASVQCAQRAAGSSGTGRAEHSAAALQLAALGVAAAECAWFRVRPEGWAAAPDLLPVAGRHSFQGGGISKSDGAAAAADAVTCVTAHGAALEAMLAAVNACTSAGRASALAAAAGVLHQLVTIRAQAVRYAYEYGRMRVPSKEWLTRMPPLTSAAFAAGLAALDLLQWLHSSSDNRESKRVDVTSAAHVFQLLQAMTRNAKDLRWPAADSSRVVLRQARVSSSYCYFAAAAGSSWSTFDAFVTGDGVLRNHPGDAASAAAAAAAAGPASTSSLGHRAAALAPGAPSFARVVSVGAGAGCASGNSATPRLGSLRNGADADADADAVADADADADAAEDVTMRHPQLPLATKLLVQIVDAAGDATATAAAGTGAR